jgi:hypothetical protein
MAVSPDFEGGGEMAAEGEVETLQLGIRALSCLEEADFEGLVSGLAETPPAVYLFQLVERIHERQPAVGIGDAWSIVRAIDVLMRTLRDDSIDSSQILELIRPVLAEMDDLGGAERVEQVLVPRLKVLVSNETLAITSKAQQVFQNQQKLFRSARIMTDIRPVFSDDGPISIRAMMVSHTLSVRYAEDDQERTWSLSLDALDLAALKRAIERAQEKERVIQGQRPVNSAKYLNVAASDE